MSGGALLLVCLAWFLTGESAAQRTRLQQAKKEQAVRSAQAELAMLEAQRADIGAFRPTSAGTVAAAEAALVALTQQRVAACASQSPHCASLTAAERAKQHDLDIARINKTATDTAKQLDAKATSIRADIARPLPQAPSEFTS